MLKTLFVFLLLIFLIPCKAQDTTKTPADTLVIYKDSLGIFNDTLSTSDTTGLLSDKKNLAKGDSLMPLFTGPLSNYSYIVNPKEIQFSNYRYTEDLLELYPFYYNIRLGSIGYSDTYFIGTQQTSYLQNGLPLTNSAYETDLNLIQSENIDSVEFIPAPRSNLYNSGMNLATVNFITKDQLWVKPYTRIKYYQGADGEAMFDGIFNSVLYKRLYGYLDVTNRTADGTYQNSAFNSWQVTARLRYLFSNDLNVTASYSYAKLYKALNGGVNIDSVGIYNNDIFNRPVTAQVNYNLQDTDQKLHNYDLKLLAKPFKNFFTDVSFYHHFYEDDVNNIDDNEEDDRVNKSNVTGMMVRTYYDVENYFNINLNVHYEKQKQSQKSALSILDSGDSDLFNFSSIVDLQFSDIIRPSIFYKYSQDRDIWNFNRDEIFSATNDYKNYQNCIGGDVRILPMDKMVFYAGYSISKLSRGSLNTLQLTASWKLDNLYLRGEFVNREYETSSMYALSGTVMFRLGSFLLESINIYDQYNVYNFRESIYFFDSVFVPNLLLKTGITMNIIGPRSYYTGSGLNGSLESDYTLDFTLAGEIRKSATIYFTWENLLDRHYYVVPFYPMQGRNLRFGIAWELLN